VTEAVLDGATGQQVELATAAPEAAAPDAPPTTPSKAAAAAGTPAKSPGPQHKARHGDVVYRVLVPARAVGIVIGKGGCHVRELQSSSGARIQVGPVSVAGPVQLAGTFDFMKGCLRPGATATCLAPGDPC
jgi:hypothetical protein